MNIQSFNSDLAQETESSDFESNRQDIKKESIDEKEAYTVPVDSNGSSHFVHFNPGVFKQKQLTTKRYFTVEEDYLI